MNQFQILLDNCLINTKHVEFAAILVAKTGVVTAAAKNFKISEDQAQLFVDAFKHVNVTRQRGINFQNKTYTCVRADKHSIYSKCEGLGLILLRTTLFVIVATYSKSMCLSVCVEAVEQLAEYLRAKGK